VAVRKKSAKPPPVLACCRVLRYAVLSSSVRYSGHSNLYVDGRELGPVPSLAICQPLDRAEILLCHCARDWTVLGAAAYASIGEAKKRAEAIYPGVARAWVDARISKSQATAYLNSVVWKGMKCTVCGKRPDEISRMLEKGKVRICDSCIREFYRFLEEDDA